MVSQPAGIRAVRSERSSQQDARAQDDPIADPGREHARRDDETKPDEPGKDQPPPRESISRAALARVHSAAKPGSA